jgi:hypothetical protein
MSPTNAAPAACALGSDNFTRLRWFPSVPLACVKEERHDQERPSNLLPCIFSQHLKAQIPPSPNYVLA